jgi:hypothetical protein
MTARRHQPSYWFFSPIFWDADGTIEATSSPYRRILIRPVVKSAVYRSGWWRLGLLRFGKSLWRRSKSYLLDTRAYLLAKSLTIQFASGRHWRNNQAKSCARTLWQKTESVRVTVSLSKLHRLPLMDGVAPATTNFRISVKTRSAGDRLGRR